MRVRKTQHFLIKWIHDHSPDCLLLQQLLEVPGVIVLEFAAVVLALVAIVAVAVVV